MNVLPDLRASSSQMQLEKMDYQQSHMKKTTSRAGFYSSWNLFSETQTSFEWLLANGPVSDYWL